VPEVQPEPQTGTRPLMNTRTIAIVALVIAVIVLIVVMS
jgi:hypothetical protein